MTDNDIIKRLERLSEEDPDSFSNDVLNYINYLKANIQQLQLSTMVREQRELIIENSKLITLNWGNPIIVAIKSEAIREFAEKLKERAFECDVSLGYFSLGYGSRHCYEDVVSVIEIDNTVAEMTESEMIKND